MRKTQARIIREVIEHKLGGYYFLPTVQTDMPASSGVILMREVAHVPRPMFTLLSEGASKREVTSLDSRYSRYFSFSIDDMVMPVSQVTSPVLEHILQTFGYLFGRIGLSNHEEGHIRAIAGHNYSYADEVSA